MAQSLAAANHSIQVPVTPGFVNAAFRIKRIAQAVERQNDRKKPSLPCSTITLQAAIFFASLLLRTGMVSLCFILFISFIYTSLWSVVSFRNTLSVPLFQSHTQKPETCDKSGTFILSSVSASICGSGPAVQPLPPHWTLRYC